MSKGDEEQRDEVVEASKQKPPRRNPFRQPIIGPDELEENKRKREREEEKRRKSESMTGSPGLPADLDQVMEKLDRLEEKLDHLIGQLDD